MKTQNGILLAPLSEEKLKSLTTEVKETLAKDFIKTNARAFTTADLWNIQRQQKARVQRRYC